RYPTGNNANSTSPKITDGDDIDSSSGSSRSSRSSRGSRGGVSGAPVPGRRWRPPPLVCGFVSEPTPMTLASITTSSTSGDGANGGVMSSSSLPAAGAKTLPSSLGGGSLLLRKLHHDHHTTQQQCQQANGPQGSPEGQQQPRPTPGLSVGPLALQPHPPRLGPGWGLGGVAASPTSITPSNAPGRRVSRGPARGGEGWSATGCGIGDSGGSGSHNGREALGPRGQRSHPGGRECPNPRQEDGLHGCGRWEERSS
ncbi:unnamed protein product, partial [Discosporangium mesarthrocarpum]